MMIYVLLIRKHVSLYVMRFKLNCFSVVLRILLHMIMYVTDIMIMNHFR